MDTGFTSATTTTMFKVSMSKSGKTAFSIFAIIGVLVVGWIGFKILDALPI